MAEDRATPRREAGERLREAAGERDEPAYQGRLWGFPPFQKAAASGLFMGSGVLLSRLGGPETLAISAYVLAALLGASHWGREALEQLVKLRVNIDVLMAVATLGCAVLGLWEEAAFLAFLYGSAEALEEWTYDRTRTAIRSLLDLAPKEATRLVDGREEQVPAQALQPGDRFLVRPGESLATDGVIRGGASSLNEAPVTGESMPVEKTTGALVFAGTLNLTGALEVEATHAFEDNTLSRIIRLVEEAEGERTRAQRFIDRFGARYSPAILLGALSLLVVPPLVGGDLREWATRAITLTVAGAPCALVMSTPVAVATAIGSAGKRGVLIKGGIHLETLGLLRAIALDKTGTLTLGRPVVMNVVPVGKPDRAGVLRMAGSVELHSEHPLARAIVAATTSGQALVEPVEFQALTGSGATARVDGQQVYVGNVDLFRELGADLRSVEVVTQERRAMGETVVLVGSQHAVWGLISLRDEIRPEAREAIRNLHRAGIRTVVMLTGDNERTARAIAGELGIDEIRADLKPDDKHAAVRHMAAAYGRVGMVGDGLNDAPALAAADVGIAMGTGGTDAAIEAADVALVGDDLRGLVYAIRLGRRVQTISRQNIIFSLILLAVLIPAAVTGLLTVVVAVMAHEGAELIAVLNGLRARVPGHHSLAA